MSPIIYLLSIYNKLNLSSFVDIEDDEDFCEKLATEENLVLLPGIHYLCPRFSGLPGETIIFSVW